MKFRDTIFDYIEIAPTTKSLRQSEACEKKVFPCFQSSITNVHEKRLISAEETFTVASDKITPKTDYKSHSKQKRPE